MDIDKISVKIADIPQINFENPQNMEKIIQESYKLLGGNGFFTPYIWKLTHKDPQNNLISGILLSNDMDFTLTYLPNDKFCLLEITSKNKINKEAIIAHIKTLIPGAAISA